MRPEEYEHWELKYLEGVYKEMKDHDENIQSARRQELQKFLTFMNNTPEVKPLQKRRTSKAKASRAPVVNLSNVLAQYKTERIGTEQDLIKCIDKVNLDKPILFREKKSVLWKDTHQDDGADECGADQAHLEDALRRGKQLRHETNKKQKDAYQMLLTFLKERNTKPVKEEK